MFQWGREGQKTHAITAGWKMIGQNLLSATFRPNHVSSPLLGALDISADLEHQQYKTSHGKEKPLPCLLMRKCGQNCLDAGRSFLLPDRRSRLCILIVIGSGSQTKLEMTERGDFSDGCGRTQNISKLPTSCEVRGEHQSFSLLDNFSGIPLAENAPSFFIYFYVKRESRTRVSLESL